VTPDKECSLPSNLRADVELCFDHIGSARSPSAPPLEERNQLAVIHGAIRSHNRSASSM
jgi:hypothetical protein